MKRSQLLLGLLAVILVVAMFFVLLFQPKRDQVAELELAIEQEQAQQTQLQAEIGRLRAVRDDAPEVEAELAAAEAIVPRSAALPAALRQLQLAADESGLVLQAVSTARPEPIEDAVTPGLSEVTVSLQLLGGYFQVVDFLRRVEDPQITPRGLVWSGAAVSKVEYPQLTVSLSGRLFAVVAEAEPLPDPAAPAPDGTTPDGTTQDGTEGTDGADGATTDGEETS